MRYNEIISILSKNGIELPESQDKLESSITGQSIGKATYDSSTEECDKAETVLNQNIKEQQSKDKEGVENNDSN